jgi:hypothetical protein
MMETKVADPEARTVIEYRSGLTMGDCRHCGYLVELDEKTKAWIHLRSQKPECQEGNR